jgi:hypothetical protein
MTIAVSRYKALLVSICVLAALVISFYGWQQLHAQGAPTTPAVATAPTSPAIAIGAVMPSGVKAMNIKNWDGTVTTILRFKYKTIDNKVITVHLPGAYKTQTMTREAWDTLFQCFGMDVEAQLDIKSQKQMEQLGDMIGQAVMQAMPQGDGSPSDSSMGYNPGMQAFDYAKAHGNTSMGAISLPPMLPGMF